jgi:RHS repeat-associated protein
MKWMHQFWNAMISVLVGLTLIFSAINPTTVYASRVNPVKPGQTPTPTPSKTAIPTSTPSPVIETPTPVATVVPATTTAPGVVLSMDVNPQFVTPGGHVNITWQIDGTVLSQNEAFLRFYIPPGLTSLEKEARVNPENGSVELPISSEKGKTDWQADETFATPAVITVEFWQGGEMVAQGAIELQSQSEFVIEKQGGTASGMNGWVHVTFPDGALSESVKVKINSPTKEALPVDSLSGSPFEITAVSTKTTTDTTGTASMASMEVTTFTAPIEIQVEYSDAGMTDEANILLYWYDPTDGQWKLPLSQSVDTETNIITAYTDHFTVFDTYNSNWQTAVTPTLSNFQHAGFTGAASFSLPIEVPAGPGGLQPSLTLSYSSSTVDNVSSKSQASWVGMGWSLTTSYIERDGHGTNIELDDSYQLNLNGMSVELMPGSDGKYHASDENFYLNQYDSTADTWTIWDKSGNQYTFAHQTKSQRLVACTNNPNYSDQVLKTWRWSLTSVRNVFGKEMTYSYASETKPVRYLKCNGDWNLSNPETWVYPSEILYANNRYRVVFVREQTRYDYEDFWLNPAFLYMSFQQSLLSSIRIEQDTSGTGTFETIIREYKFNYCQSQSCSIFPNLVWTAGGRTPTLLSVQEYGLGGVQGGQSLPAYTFTYGDGMHLTHAENGYGGNITFAYDDWHETIPFEHDLNSDPWHDGILDTATPLWGNPMRYKFRTNAENWTGTGGNSGVTSNGSGKITVWGTVQNTALKSYQPGRWYRVVASVRVADGGTHSMQLGFGYKRSDGTVVDQFGSVNTLPINAYFHTLKSEPIFLPLDAVQIIPKMNSVGNNVVDWYYLFPLPTAYRVTSRTLAAGSNTYTYTYDYTDGGVDTAATNNPTLSAAAGGPHPYIAPYTEYRGNGLVTETDPYGTKTITEYNQGDVVSGRPSSVTIKNSTGRILQQAGTTYASSEWTSTLSLYDQDTTSQWGGTLYDAQKYFWVRTDIETKGVYGLDMHNQGVLVASTQTSYEYESTYGNVTSQTVSGTDIPTLTTQMTYYSNTSSGKYIVGLPDHTWVTNSVSTLAESFNLYEFNQYNNLTGATTRTLMRLGQYSQADVEYDEWGNVITQTVWTGYGTADTSPTTGAQTSYFCYGQDDPTNGCGHSQSQDPTGLYPYHTYPLWVRNAAGHVAYFTYNTAYGVPTSETGPNGAATKVEAEYDAFGRLIQLIRPGDDSASPTLQIAYSNSPFVVTLTQKIQAGQFYTVTRQYDGMGRPTSVTAGGTSTLYTYGFENGKRMEQVSTPFSGSETYSWAKTVYDALGRPTTVTAPDGTVTATLYNGLTTKVTDARGNATTTVMDILGRTLSVVPPTGPNIVFTYDDLGNLKTAERGGATVTMGYDLGGRKTGMEDPDMGVWTYDYDALSNLKVQTDARGCALSMDYDVLNRLTDKTSSGAGCGTQVNTTYTYDEGTYGIGFRTSMADGTSTNPTSWEYDARGRLVKETKWIDSQSFTTEWDYNSADLPIWMKYPDTEVVNYEYDARMLPISVTGKANYVTSMAYDSAGRMISRTLSNGLTQAFGYYGWSEKVNNVGQGARLKTLMTGTLQNLAYQYDAVGNVTQIVNSAASETNTYQYDELNRLRFWTLNNVTEEYSYDTAGNLDVKNGMDLNYDDADHVHAVTHIGETQKYWYDENGNQETRIYGADTYTQVYDAENRMVEVKKGINTIAKFTYNGDGQKVKSEVNGETVYLVNGYYEKKGSEITKYYFAGASRIAMRKYTIPQSMELEYMLGDHLGSTSITTDTTGAKVSEMRYTPWGEVRYHWVDEDLITDPAYKLPVYTFTGQRSFMDDPSTTAVEGFGLLDYNARMYDPAIGRFVSADSIVAGGVQGYDRFNYVGNAPTVYTDPSGHFRTDPGDGGSSSSGDNGDGAKGPSSCSTGTSQIEKNYMKQSMVSNDRGIATGNAIASIGAQNPWHRRGAAFFLGKEACFANNATSVFQFDCGSDPYYTGRGLAKVSDAAMDTPYGTEVAGGHGYGLGLSEVGIDQTTPEGAVVAMKARIQIMFSVYLNKCVGQSCQNDTNSFLLAAMAGNGIEVQDVEDRLSTSRPDGIFNWYSWLKQGDESRWTVLQDFVNNWAWLESQGFELPEDIDWNYVCQLLERHNKDLSSQ